MKSYIEVENMYKKLKDSSVLDDTATINFLNFNNGIVETLEMIMDSLNMHDEAISREIISEYREYLEERQLRDTDIYGEDITLGWLSGSIKAVKWYLG